MSIVAILGASPKEGRYARKAQEMLIEYGHEVVPVNTRYEEVLGLHCFNRCSDCQDEIDTVTFYVSPRFQDELIDDVLRKRPRRAIFNPGTENPKAERRLEDAGILVERACTLVLLNTGQF